MGFVAEGISALGGFSEIRLRFQDVLLDRRHADARNEWAGASQPFGDNQK
jgi:hypothetical protein